MDLVVENDLEQQVDFPTRKDTILDLIMTSHPSFKTRCKPLPSTANSDHDIILYDTSLAPHRPKPPHRKIYLWKKADTEGIKQDVHEYAQTFEFDQDPASPSASDLEQMWMDFKEKLYQNLEKRVPSKITPPRYSNPWINTLVHRAIPRKQRAYKKARKTGKKKDVDRYKRLQAQAKYEIRQASKRYMEDIVSEDLSSNPKRFWAYIKSKGQEPAGVSPLRDKDGFLKSDNVDVNKAEILNYQFKSVFTEEDTTNIPNKGKSPFPEMPTITVGEANFSKISVLTRQLDQTPYQPSY